MEKRHQVTIKDIAKKLGISPSTVSRALKNNPSISPATRKKVIELANKLQYEPNKIALSLKNQSTKTIGVIIPEIIHFFFSTVISGIEKVAYSKGYTVLLCQSNESYEKEVIDTKALLSHRVDGILVSHSRETTNFDHFSEVKNRNIPIVFFDRIPNDFDAPSVIIDDFSAAQQATQHLIHQGCKRIAHLAGPKNLEISQKRVQGYLSALEQNNLEKKDSYIINCYEGTKEEGYLGMKKLLQLRPFPDGIFANNDVLAFGAMKAIKDAGLNIPQDIAVIGFSNWNFSSLIEPRLSSVAQPGLDMGKMAVTTLIDQLENSLQFDNCTAKVLPTDLIIRESSNRQQTAK